MAYLNNKNKKKCTGCRACEHICPFNAIDFKSDEEGFLFPTINEEKCKQCGKCTRECAYINGIYGELLEEQEVYAAKIKNEEILYDSSSGGIFTVFANETLNNGGSVCGCILDKNFMAKHIFVDRKEDLYKLRGSKYIQSDVNNTFVKTKEKLEEGNSVLYVGTPCQIAGLKQFLKKDYDNLLLIDLICHGVASPSYFKQYIEYLENRLGCKIIEYKFRDKSKFGWVGFGSYTYSNKNKKIKKYTLPEKDCFFNNYNSGIILRQSCYECKYAKTKREGDITLADFWGIEKYYPKIKTDKGVSVIILNTIKGKKIFENVKPNIDYMTSKIEYIVKENGNIAKPSNKPVERDKLFEDLRKNGFEYISKKYLKKSGIKVKIKRIIPKNVKNIIKKIIRRKKWTLQF